MIGDPFRLNVPVRVLTYMMLSALTIGRTSSATDIASPASITSGFGSVVEFNQTGGGGIPAYIWRFEANSNQFILRDVTSNTYPLWVQPGSPDYSIYVKSTGNIGLGTNDPQRELHILGSDTPTIRLEQSAWGGFPARTWGIEANDQNFQIHDVTGGTKRPFKIKAGAPNNTLILASNGSVGAGTDTPNDAASATNLPGLMLNLKSTGAGTAGLARLVTEGAAGAQMHLIHSGTSANQRVMRIQTTNGLTYFNSVRDDMATNLVSGCLVIRHLTGNVGFQNLNPQHPIHMKSGAHCTAGGVWTNASSRELKQDVEPITSEQARDAVRKLQPVGYRYKEELDETYVGFIAEDVPELVATRDRKSLAPMDITAVLTKVVQDQDRQLTEQCRQLTDERRRNDKLEQLVTSLMQRVTDLEQARPAESR